MKIENNINKFLTDLSHILVQNFGKKILGIYIYGSLSYGDYEDFRSDIDVMAFIKSPFNEKELHTLKDIYNLPKIKNNKLLKKLEMDYICIQDVNQVKNNIKTTCFRGCKVINSTMNGFSIDLKNLLETGIIIYGPEPSTFIPRIDKRLIDEALLEKYKHLAKNAPNWTKQDFWNQMFIIVQLCRIIYSVQNQHQSVSKKKATKWCTTHVPDKYTSIVKKALSGIDDWNKPMDPEIKKKLNDFINYTKGLVY